jgi:hypothetical protein
MGQARAQLEERARRQAEGEQAAYEETLAHREERQGSAKGRRIQPPKDTPDGGERINLTDADSRIMRRSKQGEYGQRYNAQAAVGADGTQLVLASRVTNCASDANELLPAVQAVATTLEKPSGALADSGYTNAGALKELDDAGIKAYVAVSRDENHTQRRYEFRPRKESSTKTITNARLLEMKKTLQTNAGRQMYARRKKSVEPVFGIIKSVLGFRQFLLRGLAKVKTEWELVCLAYNVKRFFRLKEA